jgi:hypothetical protein
MPYINKTLPDYPAFDGEAFLTRSHNMDNLGKGKCFPYGTTSILKNG